MGSATRTELAALNAAFAPFDPHKYARKSGGMTIGIVQAVQALRRGDQAEAMQRLQTALEDYAPYWADFLWPDAEVQQDIAA